MEHYSACRGKPGVSLKGIQWAPFVDNGLGPSVAEATFKMIVDVNTAMLEELMALPRIGRM
ncbi:MAG: hypothetical protein R3B95_20105 [Nitrospirales bacterium]|nr:hypothetical protein [Nitrospira sp.]MDR4485468.1 hypothetical protein [Nitrospirales bacterium]